MSQSYVGPRYKRTKEESDKPSKQCEKLDQLTTVLMSDLIVISLKENGKKEDGMEMGKPWGFSAQ